MIVVTICAEKLLVLFCMQLCVCTGPPYALPSLRAVLAEPEPDCRCCLLPASLRSRAVDDYARIRRLGTVPTSAFVSTRQLCRESATHAANEHFDVVAPAMHWACALLVDQRPPTAVFVVARTASVKSRVFDSRTVFDFSEGSFRHPRPAGLRAGEFLRRGSEPPSRQLGGGLEECCNIPSAKPLTPRPFGTFRCSELAQETRYIYRYITGRPPEQFVH